MFFDHILKLVSNRAIYQKIYWTEKYKNVFHILLFLVLPVDSEEEVVDADGDGVPGGGHVAPTVGGGIIVTMNRTLSQVQDQSWRVWNQENKN